MAPIKIKLLFECNFIEYSNIQIFVLITVTCQVSDVNCNSRNVRARKLKFEKKNQLVSHVICHMSCVIGHA